MPLRGHWRVASGLAALTMAVLALPAASAPETGAAGGFGHRCAATNGGSAPWRGVGDDGELCERTATAELSPVEVVGETGRTRLGPDWWPSRDDLAKMGLRLRTV